MPQAIRDRPALKRHLLPVWDAFHALGGDRQLGLVVGPIPFGAIDRYAARMGIVDRDEFARFHALITSMDVIHQRHMAEQARETARLEV